MKTTRSAAWPHRLAALALLGTSTGVPAADGTFNNADTGIYRTQCYRTTSNSLTGCRSTDLVGQDGQIGRDVDAAANRPDDGLLGFSFTRVCNSGQSASSGTCPAMPTLGDAPDNWGCVIDNVTGIWWEVKTLSGPRARDLKYTNYSAGYDPVGQFGSPTDATGYVNAVNRSTLCGWNDWNLAHTGKVLTVIAYGNVAATTARVDTGWFPYTQADWYWNDSPNLSAQSTAFAVNFADGSVNNDANRATPRYVQVLRNGKAVVGSTGRFEISADGVEALDTTQHSRLSWRRCVEGMSWNGSTCVGSPRTFTHEQALQWAAQQAATTGQGWRVPSVKELNGIVDRELASPPIRHSAFPNTPAASTWSSTPEVRMPRLAWAVDFSVGLVLPHDRAEALDLRLARDPDTP